MSGRLPKDGALYFSKDTDYYTDDKIRMLRAEFGAKGMYLLDYILCEIYGKNGYFMKWDKDKRNLVSDGAGCGCTPEFVSEFIAGCIRCSFFERRVFDMFGVLTSHGIQKRFIKMLRNRTTVKMIEEYWLLDLDDSDEVPASVLNKLVFKKITSADNSILSAENPDLSAENALKKRKEKERKENTNARVRNSGMSTFDASEFDDPKDYTVPDLSKRKVGKK